MVFFGIIVGFISGVCVCMYIRDSRIITLTDTYTPNQKRSNAQQTQDDVMQLKNEIANSGVIKRTYIGDDKVKLTIKVIK